MWKGKIFFRFLFSYIMVMLIPIIVCSVAYNNTVKIVEHDAQEASLSVLEQSMVVLDRRFAEVERIATQLSLNTEVLNFARELSPYIDRTVPCKINELQQKIAPLTFGNDFIKSVCVYFKRSGVTISNIKSYISLDQFYGDIFKYDNMSKTEWQNEILAKKYFNEYFPVAPVKFGFEREPEGMLMYMKSFSLPTLNKGQIIIFISENKIRELFQDTIIDQGGMVYITDSKERILLTFSLPDYAINPDDINLHELNGSVIQSIKDQKMIINCKISSYNGWKYVFVLPYDIVMKRVQYMEQMITIVLLMSMLFGLVGAFFMAYHNCKPIKGIVDILQKLIKGEQAVDNEQNEFAYLRKSILNLISDNKSMQENFKKQLPILKMIFIERLLFGDFANDNEIQWFLDQLGLVRFNGNIFVAISQIDNFTLGGDGHVAEISAIKTIIEDAVHKHMGTDVYFYDLDFDKQVILFSISKIIDFGEENYVEQVLSNISEDIYEIHNINVYFSIGSIVEDYMEISRSYDQARETLDYVMLHRRKGKSIIWYWDIPKDKEIYSYPLNIESRLINFAKLGDKEKIDEILKRIYKENFVKRNISPDMMMQLIYELKGTLLKVIDVLAAEHREIYKQLMEKICSLDACKSIDEMFTCILNIFNDVCNLVEDDRKNRNSNTIDSILEYIESNYKDPQLSLVSLAEQFGFAPAYLSQLFKDKTGENFSTYLERLRIEKACKLLMEEVKVNQVATEVGYNNVYVFRKAFKRNKGVVPSEYKSNMGLKEFIL